MEQIIEAKLIGCIIEQDTLLQQVRRPLPRDVLAMMSSVSGAEFANAGLLGIKSELRISVFALDYNGEDTVEVAGRQYKVYRTYQSRPDRIELYLRAKEAEDVGID